jgi:hypothetical protein
MNKIARIMFHGFLSFSFFFSLNQCQQQEKIRFTNKTIPKTITVIVIYYFQGTSVYKGPKAIYPLNENSMVLSL